jgi:hypothetical protein
MTVTPAYGRDYTSAKKAEKDFKDGKDFIIRDIMSRWDGKACSVRDFDQGTKINIRYNKNTKVTVVTV